MIGQVRLLTRAPAGGESVALTSDRPEIAAVPAHVTIAAGARMAVFRVTTASAAASWVTRISATAEGDTVSALLTVVRR